MVVALQGTANLYQSLRVELNNRLQTFEQFALAESLKVPAGLMAPAAPAAGGEGEVDEAAEAEAEAALVELRRQIAAAKRQGREMAGEEAELRRLIDDLGGKLARLEAVPAALAGKDNLLEDIRAIADRGVALEAGCARLESLRGGQDAGAAAAPGGDGGADVEGMSGERPPRGCRPEPVFVHGRGVLELTVMRVCWLAACCRGGGGEGGPAAAAGHEERGARGHPEAEGAAGGHAVSRPQGCSWMCALYHSGCNSHGGTAALLHYAGTA
jgi:hypothetical protein